ncbi:cytochrome p450 monooxygenase protein [Rutstroemia sp. NJR-2017a WRK4]|nr:cytochrome p450 monooxygenase protein [Rutstroemia sp. NJR-2017a WRK4]
MANAQAKKPFQKDKDVYFSGNDGIRDIICECTLLHFNLLYLTDLRWFNFTTFDLIGDLCFGESFDALRTEEYNSWIANIFKSLKFTRLFRVMRAYPLIGMPVLSMLALFRTLQRAKYKHVQYTKDKSSRRLYTHTDSEIS